MTSRKILVCCGTGCLANNSFEIYTSFLEKLKDTNTEVIPKIKATGCNGLCEKGPVVKILPDEISYFKVKSKDVDEIISKTISKGEIIDRLLYFDTNSRFFFYTYLIKPLGSL
jgi:(2Fe-2S) ferredoxin